MSTEDRVRDALARRADQTPHGRTPLADVERTARGIRRRRRAGTALATAAVVAAVAVPVGLAVGGGSDPRSESPPVATDPATPAVPALGLGLVVDDVFRPAQGEPLPLPVEDAVSVTVDGSELLVASDPGDEGPLVVSRVDAEGEVVGTSCATSVPVTSPSGDVVATTRSACPGSTRFPTQVTVQEPDGAWDWEVGGDARLVAVDDGGERVLFYDVAMRALKELTRDGFETMPVPDPPVDVDLEHDRVLVMRPGDDAPTAAVVTLRGAELWSRPGLFATDFSPDGAHVLAGDARTALVLDAATGDVVTRLPEDPLFDQLSWEDADSLVALVTEGRRQYVVRYDLGGGVTEVPLRDPLPPRPQVFFERR